MERGESVADAVTSFWVVRERVEDLRELLLGSLQFLLDRLTVR